MLTGDIVVEIDGKPVRQPEDLIRIVGEHREDQELEIIVLRGDPILKYGLFEMLHQPEQFSPILAIAIMSQMRTKFTVSLGEWSIDG
jgi:PDZ domain-containing secreted protein